MQYSDLLLVDVDHAQGQESIHFQDVLCQMIDMVRPRNPLAITIEDMMPPSKRMYCGE
jgi:hypothetical protein